MHHRRTLKIEYCRQGVSMFVATRVLEGWQVSNLRQVTFLPWQFIRASICGLESKWKEAF